MAYCLVRQNDENITDQNKMIKLVMYNIVYKYYIHKYNYFIFIIMRV